MSEAPRLADSVARWSLIHIDQGLPGVKARLTKLLCSGKKLLLVQPSKKKASDVIKTDVRRTGRHGCRPKGHVNASTWSLSHALYLQRQDSLH
ncbi:unnamed protein product [Strongylus vulgaris]|uniref:Uncharacterized protein n=1 Tax=Strongylus vulgaris TaxID=40348 RepID=A0A3P7JZ26_STRVU|nr:unnamed protein product [Strongylus vulgaris]